MVCNAQHGHVKKCIKIVSIDFSRFFFCKHYKDNIIAKIDIETLNKFQECIDDEENKIYQQRVISFLKDLKERYE